MKILVVDDSRAMRMIVKRALGSIDRYRDATILEAADGGEALELIAAEQPDVVLSDWNMPEVTGIQLLQSLRERGLGLTFGFVTSESTPEMYDQALANGARFLVSKPFTAETLERALATAS